MRPDTDDAAPGATPAAEREDPDAAAIRDAVRATIGAIAPDADVRHLRPDQPLRQQIDLDSMDWLNVVADLQDRLSLDVPDADIAQLQTLDSIVAYVTARRAAKRDGAPIGGTTAPDGLPCATHVVGGVTVTVRPMRPDDSALEAEFVRNLSSDARYNRFMVTLGELSPKKLAYLVDVDQVRHVALVALVERDGRPRLAGVARYVVEEDGGSCEFAITVDDAWQRSGLAGILMQALIDVARARGLRTMNGYVLATNNRMLKFVRQLGFSRRHDPDEGDMVRISRPL